VWRMGEGVRVCDMILFSKVLFADGLVDAT
jgi:hypothetical protein